MNWLELDGYASLPPNVKAFLNFPNYGSAEYDVALTKQSTSLPPATTPIIQNLPPVESIEFSQAMATIKTTEETMAVLGQQLINQQAYLFSALEKAMQMAKTASDMEPDDIIRLQAALMTEAIHNYVTSASAVLTTVEGAQIISPTGPNVISVPIPVGIT